VERGGWRAVRRGGGGTAASPGGGSASGGSHRRVRIPGLSGPTAGQT
jgi:hypothetical protein